MTPEALSAPDDASVALVMPTDFVRPSPGTGASHVARLLYDWRRARDDAFGADASVFAEPSWDILLDLFIWQEEGRRISVSSSCIASGRPTTTAMRHIKRLEAQGLVCRTRDRDDGRRCWLELTAKADALLRRHIEHIGGHVVPNIDRRRRRPGSVSTPAYSGDLSQLSHPGHEAAE